MTDVSFESPDMISFNQIEESQTSTFISAWWGVVSKTSVSGALPAFRPPRTFAALRAAARLERGTSIRAATARMLSPSLSSLRAWEAEFGAAAGRNVRPDSAP